MTGVSYKMKQNNFIPGVITGLVLGHLAYHYVIEPRKRIDPELVLNSLKAQLKNTHPIKNSWISYTPENFKHHDVITEVYRGGLADDLFTDRYEFVAESKSGTLIDLYKVI
ncbi:hypothetical protein [Brochothrix thermosphacta]|uniref:hypothetical protein n=1 Tax=Brochothrix thermosphacta TaxID=2756 RepID=UPI00083F641E|nr:hypothetical protein [Brochothrix thermosphacta]ODJ66670.1 hypothetical protein BFR35_05695 [Brochothrix thermosphacta]ODJ67293.1 hypothetical protein BFR37_06345 [Brochothrix thermosphacta]SPN72262.1 Protein of unknown function [Brochothrix thermosphacta]